MSKLSLPLKICPLAPVSLIVHCDNRTVGRILSEKLHKIKIGQNISANLGLTTQKTMTIWYSKIKKITSFFVFENPTQLTYDYGHFFSVFFLKVVSTCQKESTVLSKFNLDSIPVVNI